jgi:ubiquinone/menaquinone biosynthesis C-methylase UbiE
MKSMYQDEAFANYWNERVGDDGEEYKRFVLDPAMFELAQPLDQRVVLEMGCGNGYRARQFLARGAARVILADISPHNLQHARRRCNDPRLTFLLQDATTSWDIPSSSIDLIFSAMMLNEVDDIATPISEAYRVLRPASKFVLGVFHPAKDLAVYAQECTGRPSKVIRGLGGYFHRGASQFWMGKHSRANPELTRRTQEEYPVEHYARPISDYFNQLVRAGFRVNALVEPEMNDALIAYNPKYAETQDYPLSLVFACLKEH